MTKYVTNVGASKFSTRNSEGIDFNVAVSAASVRLVGAEPITDHFDAVASSLMLTDRRKSNVFYEMLRARSRSWPRLHAAGFDSRTKKVLIN